MTNCCFVLGLLYFKVSTWRWLRPYMPSLQLLEQWRVGDRQQAFFCSELLNHRASYCIFKCHTMHPRSYYCHDLPFQYTNQYILTYRLSPSIIPCSDLASTFPLFPRDTHEVKSGRYLQHEIVEPPPRWLLPHRYMHDHSRRWLLPHR